MSAGREIIQPGAGSQYLVFNLVGQTFGFGVTKVREVLKSIEATPVPGSGPFLQGIINIRGEMLPIVNLSKKLGLSCPSAEDAKMGQRERRIIVVENDLEGRLAVFGIYADSVEKVRIFTAEQINPTPTVEINLDNRLVQGIVVRPKDFVILLDVARLFTLEELTKIQDATPLAASPKASTNGEEIAAPGESGK